jgi:hypothetical protein
VTTDKIRDWDTVRNEVFVLKQQMSAMARVVAEGVYRLSEGDWVWSIVDGKSELGKISGFEPEYALVLFGNSVLTTKCEYRNIKKAVGYGPPNHRTA